MRWIVNYIRSCFCAHEFELIFNVKVHTEINEYLVKTYRCKKCGYAKRYKSHK